MSANGPPRLPWLGDLPAHWTLAPAYARLEVQLGKMLDEKRITGDHLAPYLRNVDVQWGRIDVDELPEMDFTPADRMKFGLRPGDLLVCEGGEVGRCALWTGAIDECYFQKALHRVRLRSPSDCNRFIFYVLFAMASRGVFVAHGNPNTIPHLTAEKLRRHRLPFPPPREQRAIADFLDRKTRAIDELIRKKERLIELLQEKRQALITQTVTKGLDPTVPMKDSGVPWLGEIPAHWGVRRVGYLSRVVRGASPRPAGDPRYFDGYHIPWITVGEITRDADIYLRETETSLTEEGRDLSRVIPAGTLLLTNSGATLGVPKITCIEGCINDGSVAFLDVSEATTNLYLYWYLTSLTKNLRERIKQGSGQPNLNTDIVKSIPIPLPPLLEQHAVLELIAERVEKVSVARVALDHQIGKLHEYRQALISAAVTGQIDVTDEAAA